MSKLFEIELVQLNSGKYLARPLGSLGNSGSWPFVWDAALENSATKAETNFRARYANQIKKYEEK